MICLEVELTADEIKKDTFEMLLRDLWVLMVSPPISTKLLLKLLEAVRSSMFNNFGGTLFKFLRSII